MSRAKKSTDGRDASKTLERNPTDDLWQKNPAVIKQFLDVRPEYEQLCTEVEYILRKKVASINVETSFVGSRAKTLNSFLEKLKRKSYDDPFSQLTDLAGARVVCLYNNDIPKIVEIIRSEFNIIEEINKLEELDSNKFGYIGRHFIVQLGRTSFGARYDDLKEMKCEIQVRTVVQDAWSIIQHHMAYKNEAQVPRKLIRKLNSLAGLFETVDDQFEMIRTQRDSYVDVVRESTSEAEKFLDNDLNYDSFIEFMNWRYPERTDLHFENQISIVVDALKSAEFNYLGQLDQYLDKNQALTDKIASMYTETEEDYDLSPAVEVAIALSINPEWRTNFPWSQKWLDLFEQLTPSA
jgi:ppGpp synthetase/RelA/SpoT-type nucleotidyltranferase